jgi:hypothetical protein
MVGGDRGADLVLVLAVRVGADVDAGDELDAVEIAEAADAAAGLRLGELSLSDTRAPSLRMPRIRAAPHVRPVRTLRAVEADQRPDLAAGIGPFEHRVFGVEIDGAGGGAARPAAGPALRRVVEAARAERQAAPWRACPSG